MLRQCFLPNFPKPLFDSAKKKESKVLAARLESLRSGGLSELPAVVGRFLHLGDHDCIQTWLRPQRPKKLGWFLGGAAKVAWWLAAWSGRA